MIVCITVLVLYMFVTDSLSETILIMNGPTRAVRRVNASSWPHLRTLHQSQLFLNKYVVTTKT